MRRAEEEPVVKAKDAGSRDKVGPRSCTDVGCGHSAGSAEENAKKKREQLERVRITHTQCVMVRRTMIRKRGERERGRGEENESKGRGERTYLGLPRSLVL